MLSPENNPPEEALAALLADTPPDPELVLAKELLNCRPVTVDHLFIIQSIENLGNSKKKVFFFLFKIFKILQNSSKIL